MNAAISGLSVSSRMAEITANNIANVGTAGYVRRSVAISELSSGAGATVDSVQRHTNDTITQQRSNVSSNLAQSKVLSTTWSNLSAQIGDSLKGTGLFKSVNDFESAIAVAANTPEAGTEANNMLQAAKDVATELNTLSERVRAERESADLAIYAAVETINEKLVEIDELNDQIQTSLDGSNHAASLKDQRRNAIDELANYLPVRTIEREDGTMDVITQEGVFLLASQVRQIEFSIGAGFTGDQTLAGGQLSGLTLAGVDITPGSTSYGAIGSGELAGLFQLRDEDLPEISAQLDSVANDLIARFTDDVADATLNPGDPGLFVDTNAAAGVDSAARIRINSLVDPAQGGEIYRLRDGLGATAEGEIGNASLLNSMLSAMQTSKSINENGIQGRYSATDLSAHISSVAGQKRVSYEAAEAATQTEFDRLLEAEQNVTGVDIDTELQTLLLIEQSYAANARVVQAATQFIQELMEL